MFVRSSSSFKLSALARERWLALFLMISLFILLSYPTLHFLLRIRLDQIPFSNGIEAFNDFCRKEIAVLVDDLNIS
jgi:hypothetical protein